jgi:hypothetical protein
MRAGAEAASYTSAASLIRAAQSMAAVEEAPVKVPSNKLLIRVLQTPPALTTPTGKHPLAQDTT